MINKKILLSAVIIGSIFIACNQDRKEGETTYAPSSTATPRATGTHEETSGSTTTGSSMGTDSENNNEDASPTPTPKKRMGPASGKGTP